MCLSSKSIVVPALPSKPPRFAGFPRLSKPSVASTISPGIVNFIANEYNDINCTDPTGNTEILSGENIGQISGECFELPGIAYAMGECRADGSYISQFFSPEDDTCSGGVWDESISAAELSPPVCIATAVDGLYYG